MLNPPYLLSLPRVPVILRPGPTPPTTLTLIRSSVDTRERAKGLFRTLHLTGMLGGQVVASILVITTFNRVCVADTTLRDEGDITLAANLTVGRELHGSVSGT